MQELWNSLVQLLDAALHLVVNLGSLLLPLLPLAVWVVFWTFAVDWRKLSRVLRQGGAVGLLLIALITILVWGVVAPPESGSHNIFGLTLSNYFGKMVYVTTLVCIMLICGSVQLSGLVDCCVDFSKFDEPADDHGHGGHGHDAHGHESHGHGDHALAHAPADHGHGGAAHGGHH